MKLACVSLLHLSKLNRVQLTIKIMEPHSFDGASLASHTSWLGVPSLSGRGASSAAGSAIDVQVDGPAEETLTVIALHPFYTVETNAGGLAESELRMSIHLWTCDMSLTAELDNHPHGLQDHPMISHFISVHSSFTSNKPDHLDVGDDLITLRDKFAAHLTTKPSHVQGNMWGRTSLLGTSTSESSLPIKSPGSLRFWTTGSRAPTAGRKTRRWSTL